MNVVLVGQSPRCVDKVKVERMQHRIKAAPSVEDSSRQIAIRSSAGSLFILVVARLGAGRTKGNGQFDVQSKASGTHIYRE